MKKKIIAIVRSAVLLVIIYLVVVRTPFEVFGSGDSMVAVRNLAKLVQGAWIAIGWIALETAIAWVQALRKPKSAKGALAVEAPKTGSGSAAAS